MSDTGGLLRPPSSPPIHHCLSSVNDLHSLAVSVSVVPQSDGTVLPGAATRNSAILSQFPEKLSIQNITSVSLDNNDRQ